MRYVRCVFVGMRRNAAAAKTVFDLLGKALENGDFEDHKSTAWLAFKGGIGYVDEKLPLYNNVTLMLSRYLKYLSTLPFSTTPLDALEGSNLLKSPFSISFSIKVEILMLLI